MNWDVEPLEVPEEIPEDDLQVLSSFFPDSFHAIHRALRTWRYSCAKHEDPNGKERWFTYTSDNGRNHVVLHYMRQRRGNYYCLQASLNGTTHKIANLLEEVKRAGA